MMYFSSGFDHGPGSQTWHHITISQLEEAGDSSQENFKMSIRVDGVLIQEQRCALAFALEDNLTAADIRLIQSDVFSKVPISKSICHQISVKLLKRHY